MKRIGGEEMDTSTAKGLATYVIKVGCAHNEVVKKLKQENEILRKRLEIYENTITSNIGGVRCSKCNLVFHEKDIRWCANDDECEYKICRGCYDFKNRYGFEFDQFLECDQCGFYCDACVDLFTCKKCNTAICPECLGWQCCECDKIYCKTCIVDRTCPSCGYRKLTHDEIEKLFLKMEKEMNKEIHKKKINK